MAEAGPLVVRLLMDTGVGEIFDFKSACCLRVFDVNLEVLVENRGEAPLTVGPHFDIEHEGGVRRLTALVPGGTNRIGPGEVKSFYYSLDEGFLRGVRSLTVYDDTGRSYKAGAASGAGLQKTGPGQRKER